MAPSGNYKQHGIMAVGMLGSISKWRRGRQRDDDALMAQVTVGSHMMVEILPRSMAMSHGPISMAIVDHSST